MLHPSPRSTLFPYTTLFRSRIGLYNRVVAPDRLAAEARSWAERLARGPSFGLEVTKKMVLREATMDLESAMAAEVEIQDRKSTRLNSSHSSISYAVFCLKKK